MEALVKLVVIVLLLGVCGVLWRNRRELQRERFIREAELPRGLFDGLRKKRPELSLKDCQLIAQGLRQFFLAYLHSGRAYVSMPSQLADDLWHEFILHTRSYERFCRDAFGGFLHHTPAVALGAQAGEHSNAGLRRVWWHTCRLENINPRAPTRLPLLFALDGKFTIADGFHYLADCQGVQRRQGAEGSLTPVVHCGVSFSDSRIDGSTEGFGRNGKPGGSSGGCGGGSVDAGGDGCGGGGCGS